MKPEDIKIGCAYWAIIRPDCDYLYDTYDDRPIAPYGIRVLDNGGTAYHCEAVEPGDETRGDITCSDEDIYATHQDAWLAYRAAALKLAEQHEREAIHWRQEASLTGALK